MTTETDVLIIGGGPAGTTIGTFLQRRGWSCTLLEKGHHPRFHIGESLLPMNLPILERLGVLDEVQEIGVTKPGADFTAGSGETEYQTFHFSDALGHSPNFAYEVRRSEFDQLLFENCKRSGADVRQGLQVVRVEKLPGRRFSVVAKDQHENEHIWTTKFLVDASGRDTFLASSRGSKQKDPRHASAAVYAHFEQVERRPGKDQGNISIYWFDHGWIWMIPLRSGVMSIGAVCSPDYLKSRRGSLDDFLRQTLDSVAEARERTTHARLIRSAQATGNYSYRSTDMLGPGYLLIGDAFAFVDPVFSSGVYLAMDSAERGVTVAEAWLEGKRLQYAWASRCYRRQTHRALKTFSWFIYRFTSPVMRNLMSQPRNLFGVVQAVISMLAGDVYANRPVQRRLLVFKAIYSIAFLAQWREAQSARKKRLAVVHTELNLND